MVALWWKTYPAKILSIKNNSQNSDKQIITVQDETTWRVMKYEAYHMLFLTTPDKIIERICFVTEDIQEQLIKIMLDDTKEQRTNEPKIVYKFDTDTLQTYYRISLFWIYEHLRHQLQKVLNQPEHKKYIISLLHEMPNFVMQHWYLQKYITTYSKKESHAVTPYDSEKIHFYYHAFKAATECFVLSRDNIECDIHQNKILGERYNAYLQTVVDHNYPVSDNIFEQYVKSFIAELYNEKIGNKKTLREQKTMNMYNNLYPIYKYYFFDWIIEPPLMQTDYAYLHTLYVAQNIYDEFGKEKHFSDMLWILIKVANKSYPQGVPTIIDDDWKMICKEDFYEYDFFGYNGEIELVLKEAFSHIIPQIYYEFEEKHPYPNYSIIDKIHENIMKWLSWPIHERWLYYTIYMLHQMYKVMLANKNGNAI